MLSKEQANAAAEALIFQAKASRVEIIPSVSWLYRCRELSSLKLRQRYEVVQQAKEKVSQNPLLCVIALAWFGVFVLFWFYGLSDSNRTSNLGLFSVLWIIPLCLSAIFVRREVRKIAMQHP
jgi:hypothetical protein